jgi:DNA polymerase-3 subunit alpha
LPGLELQPVEVPARERLAWEKELLGVYLSEHPFAHASRQLSSQIDVFCGQISEEMIGQIVITAGTVTSVRQSFTKDKRPFVAAVIEDFGGSIEVTAWTEVYERTKDIWQEGNTLLVKGKVKARGEGVQLTCLTASLYQPGSIEEPPGVIEPPQAAPSRRRLQINLPTSEDTNTDIQRLRQVFATLEKFPGEDEVNLAIVSTGKITKMEVPDPTGYCSELHRQLAGLVGEDNLIVT